MARIPRAKICFRTPPVPGMLQMRALYFSQHLATNHPNKMKISHLLFTKNSPFTSYATFSSFTVTLSSRWGSETGILSNYRINP